MDDRMMRIAGILWDSLIPLIKVGLMFTVPLALTSFALGLLLAFITALARISSNRVLKSERDFFERWSGYEFE